MEQESKKQQIGRFVYGKIMKCQNTAHEGEQKAILAELRHGIGKMPGEIPSLWGAYLADLPEELMGYGTQPSPGEWAVYTALTMFALHQQGKDPKTHLMHQKDFGIGRALGMLAKKEGDPENARDRIFNRFYPMASADDMEKFTHYLRGIVTLLRSADIPMDYVQLAEELYHYQFEDTRPALRLRWGEDFYREMNRTSKEENQSN